MRGSGSPFSPGERERMAAFVSRLNGCVFCEASHGAAAARFGADPAAVSSAFRALAPAFAVGGLAVIGLGAGVSLRRPPQDGAAESTVGRS